MPLSAEVRKIVEEHFEKTNEDIAKVEGWNSVDGSDGAMLLEHLYRHRYLWERVLGS